MQSFRQLARASWIVGVLLLVLAMLVGCTASTPRSSSSPPSPSTRSVPATCAQYKAVKLVNLGPVSDKGYAGFVGNPNPAIATISVGEILQVSVPHSTVAEIAFPGPARSYVPLESSPFLAKLCEIDGFGPTAYFQATKPGTQMVIAFPRACECDMMPFNVRVHIVE